LQRCRDDGKIQYIGCCNLTKELIDEANKSDSLESIQSLFNIVERGNAALLRNCFYLNMGCLIYGVLARGLFTGKYDRNFQFGENDTRFRDDRFKGEKLVRNLLVVDHLKKLGSLYRKSPAQVAVRWALDLPFVTCAILGIKDGGQVIENMRDCDWILDRDDWLSLDHLIDEL
jgi:myo-inositol catabolism protein IolS